MTNYKQQPSEMGKSTTTIYKVVAFLVIVTVLIYVHDIFPKHFGKIGLSTVRVYLYTVLAEIRFLLVLFFCFYLAKGKQWRFVLLLPIIMTGYQAGIRILALQKTQYNEFDLKLTLTIVIFLVLTIYYFKRK